MLAASGAVAAPSTRAAATEATAVVSQAVDLADAANRLMNQVVGTIHTYQTSSGPALETRISDPVLGDVRVIASGRAGEIVQAQLVVRDRVSADAISAAVTRMRSTGDGLTGVSVTVRTEGGDSSLGSRSGSNPFEAGGWANGNGYGAGSGNGNGNGNGNGHAQSQALAGGDPSALGGGSGNGTGAQPRGGGQAGTAPSTAAAVRVAPKAGQPAARMPIPGRSTLDIRA